MKESLKWIVTRWHFWALVVGHSISGIISDSLEYILSWGLIVGDILGSFIFIFFSYILVMVIIWIGRQFTQKHKKK